MKKLLVIGTLALSMTASVLADGTIAFINNNSTLITCDASAAAALGLAANAPITKGKVYMGLYYAPDSATAPAEANMTLLKQVDMGLAAGKFNGGAVDVPATTAAGTPAWFQTRSWAQTFASYSAAVDAGGPFGKSGIFKLAPGAITPTQLTDGMTAGFAVSTIVPEPSALALGLIGLAGLFVIRRRQ